MLHFNFHCLNCRLGVFLSYDCIGIRSLPFSLLTWQLYIMPPEWNSGSSNETFSVGTKLNDLVTFTCIPKIANLDFVEIEIMGMEIATCDVLSSQVTKVVQAEKAEDAQPHGILARMYVCF